MNELSKKKDREILIINFSEEVSDANFSRILEKHKFVKKQEEKIYIDSKGNTFAIVGDLLRIVISEENDLLENLSSSIVKDLNECDFLPKIKNLGLGLYTVVKIKTDITINKIVINDYLNILPYYSFKNLKIEGVNAFNVELSFKDYENDTKIYTTVETLNEESNDFVVFIAIDKEISGNSSFLETFNIVKNLYPYYIDEIINEEVNQNE